MPSDDKKPRGLGKLRQRLAAHPKKEEKFDETVKPILRDVRQTMAGEPEDAVYNELTRRLTEAGVDVPPDLDDNLRGAAGRISRRDAK